MTFRLIGRNVKLANFSSRVENHGDDRVPACDLKIEMALPNKELKMFDENLMSAFYWFDPQQGGDLVDHAHADEDPSGYLPHRRFPKLGTVPWNHEIIGASVRIEYGVRDDESAIKLGDCKVNKFSFDPQNGGTVATYFRIQAHPDGEAAGQLYELQGNEITLTIEPPTAAQQAEMKAAATGSGDGGETLLTLGGEEGDGTSHEAEGGESEGGAIAEGAELK